MSISYMFEHIIHVVANSSTSNPGAPCVVFDPNACISYGTQNSAHNQGLRIRVLVILSMIDPPSS